MKFKKTPIKKTSLYYEDKYFTRKLLSIESAHIRYPNNFNNDLMDISYTFNEYGFRSDTFSNQDILFLGCSHTFGEGLPKEYRWTDILASNLNMSYSNLGLRGDSAINQIRHAFWYFKNFGNPKIVVGLFPLGRMPFPSVPYENISENRLNAINKNGDSQSDPHHKYTTEYLNMSKDKVDDFSRSPYDLSKVISLEGAIYHNNIAFEMLIQYCESHNIKLFWSIWDAIDKKNDIVELIYKEKYKSYVDINATKWTIINGIDGPRWSPPPLCHEEYNKDVDIIFNQAADRKNNNFPHWGAHRHIHIANEFYYAIKRKEFIYVN